MRTKQSALAAALGVALAAAVAACGSSSPQASAPAPASTTTSQSGGHSSSVSPTALLSLSDAANITGDSAITERNATSSAVTYSDHNTGDTVYIVVSRTSVVNASALESAIAAYASGRGSYQQVSGIGDAAYEQTLSNEDGVPNEADLAFAKGNTIVAIGAISSTKNDSVLLTSIESVASRVAAQL